MVSAAFLRTRPIAPPPVFVIPMVLRLHWVALGPLPSPSLHLLSPPWCRDCIRSPLSLSRSCRGYVDGPRVNRWPPRCGTGGSSPPPPPPTHSSFPWCCYCVQLMPLQGGVAVVASIAQAVVGRLGFAATAMDALFPSIPSSPTMALNVNECGTVSSLLFYQVFTHPPLLPPLFSFVSASASDHPP